MSAHTEHPPWSTLACQADLHWDGGCIFDAGSQLFLWLGPAWQHAQATGGGSATFGSTGGTGFFGLHARVAALAETEAEAVAASELLGTLELATAFARDQIGFDGRARDQIACARVRPGDEPGDFTSLFASWDLGRAAASLASVDPYEAALQRLRNAQREANARGGGAVASQAAIAHELQQTIEVRALIPHPIPHLPPSRPSPPDINTAKLDCHYPPPSTCCAPGRRASEQRRASVLSAGVADGRGRDGGRRC
jgi:hypothetical protein